MTRRLEPRPFPRASSAARSTPRHHLTEIDRAEREAVFEIRDGDTVSRTELTPLDTMKERYDMWLLKRYGIPFLYWNGMMRGIVAPPWAHQ